MMTKLNTVATIIPEGIATSQKRKKCTEQTGAESVESHIPKVLLNISMFYHSTCTERPNS